MREALDLKSEHLIGSLLECSCAIVLFTRYSDEDVLLSPFAMFVLVS